MPKHATLSITILSYWHAGSGIGRGADVDALVQTNSQGLPYLPGRTLKGLLREGLQTLEDAKQVAAGRTNALFGTPAVPGQAKGSIPGCLAFSSASLPEAEACWLAAPDQQAARAALFDRFASTRLTETGMAEDKTLRTIELCVPVQLTAHVQGPDANWEEDLQKACILVRALGSHRHRGLGRCVLTLSTTAKGDHHA